MILYKNRKRRRQKRQERKCYVQYENTYKSRFDDIKKPVENDYVLNKSNFLFKSVNKTHTYKPTYIHKNIPDYTRETIHLAPNGQ